MKSSKIIFMDDDPDVHMVVRKIQFESIQAAYTVFDTFKRDKLFPRSEGIHRCDDVMFGKLETELARHSLFYFEKILGRR
jgi:hypothetical protein